MCCTTVKARSEVRRALPLDWPIAVHVEMPLTGLVDAEMCVAAGSFAFEVQLGALGAGSQAPPPRASTINPDAESQDATFICHTYSIPTKLFSAFTSLQHLTAMDHM
jgi:hypothetical protein